MMDVIFGTVAGWLGVAGLIVAACFAVAWFIPSLRPYAIAAGAGAIAVATAYTKGSRDRAALERKRKEEAVQRARDDYANIDARPDSSDDVTRRMQRGDF